jgi:peroxiredoxin
MLALGAATVLRAVGLSGTLAVAAVGRAAPEFDLAVAGNDARHVSLVGLRGRPVVVVFNCGCRACADFDRTLATAGQRITKAHVIAITSNRSAFEGRKLAQFREETGFRWPVLVDRRMETTLRYGSSECPRVWLVDGGGLIRYTGPGPSQTARAAVEALAAVLGRI